MKTNLQSVRVRAILIVLLVSATPLIFIWLSPPYEASRTAFTLGHLEETADQVEPLLDDKLDAGSSARLAEVVRARQVWLRAYELDESDPALAPYIDRGVAEAWNTRAQIERYIFSKDDSLSLEIFDAERAGLKERREFAQALQKGMASGYFISKDERVLVCYHARVIERSDGARTLLYLEQAALRGIPMLWNSRSEIVRLVLQMVVVGLILGLFLGWRIVRPLEKLREQVSERTKAPVSTRPIELDRDDEIGDVVESFNDLLGALEERRRANEAFMADIAHEIKNPVAAIRACSERMKDVDKLDEKRAARLARILEDSSKRLDALVSRFLELARAEAGLPDEERELFAVDEMLEALVETYRADQRYSDVDFRFESKEASDSLTIEGAPNHLETAFRNLIENAASFALQGVSADDNPRVWVGLVRVDDAVTIEVGDNGPGVAPEDLPHIFDRFFTRRHDDGGTGLGLAMTRAIVEAHGGTIKVDSTEGEGTVFRVNLA